MADVALSGKDIADPGVGDFLVAVDISAANGIRLFNLLDIRAVYNVKDYGALGDGVNDDTAEIQAAIAAAAAAGGGIVYLPAGTYVVTETLAITASGVVLVGQGAAGNVDAYPLTKGTVLYWLGGASPLVRFTATNGGTWPLTHCGVIGMTLSCHGLATIGLELISVRESLFSEVFVRNPVTAGILVDVVASLTNARDSQQNLFERITIRCVDGVAASAKGIVLHGKETANASYNHFHAVQIHYTNGTAVQLGDADSNIFEGVQCFRVGGGAGIGFELLGETPVTIGGHARYNSFYSCNPHFGGIVARGTGETNPSDRNMFYDVITSNQPLSLTVEPGATLLVETQEGNSYEDGVLRSGDARSAFVMEDDFANRLGSNGSIGDLGWTVFGGAVSQAAAELHHPGISRLGTGGSANTYTGIYPRGTATVGIIDADQMFDFLVILRPNQADAATLLRVGLANSAALNPPANGIYVEKLAADTSWFGVTRAGSSENRTAAVAAAAAAWTRVRVRRINATTVGFTINDNAEVTATLTIPGNDLQPFIAINNASGDKNVDIDYIRLAASGLAR